MTSPLSHPPAGKPPTPEGLRIRVVFPGGRHFGPGRADLLDLIRETGSIAAAGRRMGMSYRRAWSLVESMNVDFAEPLVESARGGAAGGGARLTPAGEAVLAAYRALQERAGKAVAEEIAVMSDLLAGGGDMSNGK